MIQWHDYLEEGLSSEALTRFRRELDGFMEANAIRDMGSMSARTFGEMLERYLESAIKPKTDILGVFVGFLGKERPTPTKEDVRLTVPIFEPIGIGVVIPIERVLEALEQPKVKEERQVREKEAWELREDDGPDYMPASADDESRPGPEPERLKTDLSPDEVAKRVMDAGKPDEGESDD